MTGLCTQEISPNSSKCDHSLRQCCMYPLWRNNHRMHCSVVEGNIACIPQSKGNPRMHCSIVVGNISCMPHRPIPECIATLSVKIFIQNGGCNQGKCHYKHHLSC